MPLAVVTGASSGLGAAYAEELAALGYDLTLIARDAVALERVATRVRSRGRDASIRVADLATEDGIAQTAAWLRETAVDVLVNNAGTGTPGEFLTSPPEVEQRMLDLNAAAVLRLCQAAVPGMVARRHGYLINVASVAGLVPTTTGPGYSASKAYVVMLTESLATSLIGTGVTATAVCPGFVRTSFHPRIGMDVSWVPSWAWLDPHRVARDSLRAAGRRRTRVTPSLLYKAALGLVRALPRPVVRRIIHAADRLGATD